jgi:hypothetical protein
MTTTLTGTTGEPPERPNAGEDDALAVPPLARIGRRRRLVGLRDGFAVAGVLMRALRLGLSPRLVGARMDTGLDDLDLDRTMPPGWPGRPEAFAKGEKDVARDRATAWGIALSEADRLGPVLAHTRGVLTSYGFARIGERVHLAVIRYLPARTRLNRRDVAPVTVDGHDFPVVLRPWSPEGHGPGHGGPGTCWVSFPSSSGARRRGLLTTLHSILPADASPGTPVRTDVLRDEPSGVLHARSETMDAALIDLGEEDASRSGTSVSDVVGYKPVRLLSSSKGPVDLDVLAFTGIVGGTISGVLGQQPLAPVVLFFADLLEHGDSGCLGLDREPERYGAAAAPYLMYLGRTNVEFGGYAGFGVLIEQARRVWGFDLCLQDDRQPERTTT